MNGVVDWAASRARMVMAFVVLSIAVGVFAYINLPKEGEPDIEIPTLVISLPFPGISTADSEKLLIKPMETELADLDGLDRMTATAAEGYANIVLEFEFGWDKTQVMADVRDAMNNAQAKFPAGFEQYTLDEFNFSEFPIIIVNLSGPVPERTVNRIAGDLQDDLEALDAVLEASLVGDRDPMVEIIIDPLLLEAYNVTAGELIAEVQNNNQLIAAGEIKNASGAFGLKIPASFDELEDIDSIPVTVNGDRIVTLGDVSTLNLTFEDRSTTARFNGDDTVALQVVKRKGFNLIDTASEVKALVEERAQDWPEGLQAAVEVGTSNDQSRTVASMVAQLQGSVLTAIALVFIVSLAFLGIRAALLVGFAVPTSFLLCFVLLAIMGISISNIVMFGLILAVGMLVDGAIVVTEYADKRQQDGVGPMQSYIEAAKRMFWPVVSSTATTLCAFLPMLFWPGVPGEFMGMLPVTLIFVLSASLVVALIYLPVIGGVLGRLIAFLERGALHLAALPIGVHLGVVALSIIMLAAFALRDPLSQAIPAQLGGIDGQEILRSVIPTFAIVFAIGVALILSLLIGLCGLIMLIVGTLALLSRLFTGGGALIRHVLGEKQKKVHAGYARSLFGKLISSLVGNPIMPLVTLGAVTVFVGTTLIYYINNNRGVEFFVTTEPEQAIVYVLARGNLSLEEKDAVLQRTETIVNAHPGVETAFSFAGAGGLNANTGGAGSPKDAIGQIQIETIPWEDRPDATEAWFSLPLIGTVERKIKASAFDGDTVIDELSASLAQIPGVRIEVIPLTSGPASSKPVHLRVSGNNWDDLLQAASLARQQFDQMPGLIRIEDTRPLPGIDFEVSVDVEKAGRYGADVATVGAMVQLLTRGLFLDTMRIDSADEEIDIRLRVPEENRLLSTLETLKVRTSDGLIPLSNFISLTPVNQLDQINRVDQTRYFDIKAGVEPGLQSLVESVEDENGDDQSVTQAVLRPADEGPIVSDDGTKYEIIWRAATAEAIDLKAQFEAGDLQMVAANPNERIAELTKWLETDPLPAGIGFEWTGEQEDQEESGQFLIQAFGGALALMFIILLAQFNSFYNALLVLLAVVLSTAGVLIGMIVMNQPFSIIMTGTGIVALAGIVVNNNIVLIDTYQEYERFIPRIEAIIRTTQDRLRPVMLTTITTMAGLAPMMFGISLNFADGGYTVDSPTALWWKQLATAVVFGLGIATILTLVVTPSLLSMRVWIFDYAIWISKLLERLSLGTTSSAARDWALERNAKTQAATDLIWGADLGSNDIRDAAANEGASPKANPSPLAAAE